MATSEMVAVRRAEHRRLNRLSHRSGPSEHDRRHRTQVHTFGEERPSAAITPSALPQRSQLETGIVDRDRGCPDPSSGLSFTRSSYITTHSVN